MPLVTCTRHLPFEALLTQLHRPALQASQLLCALWVQRLAAAFVAKPETSVIKTSVQMLTAPEGVTGWAHCQPLT